MKTVLVGFDAFDPQVVERLLADGKLPNLAELMNQGSYRQLTISNPAQSEVSWTSIATGLNPAGHGLFDFVHRNPANYSLQVSMLPTQKSIIGTQFVPPYQARTFFEHAVEQGYPATSLWWPATFPAKMASPVQSIPGLGTPDVLGQIGVGALFSVQDGLDQVDYKSQVNLLHAVNKTQYQGALRGPKKKQGKEIVEAELLFTFDVTAEDSVVLTIGDQKVEFPLGAWSPILEISFKLGLFSSMPALTRAIVSLTPAPQIYFLPLQIHPLRSPWPYGTPMKMVKQAWKDAGPFLTLGWPQDTTALNENIITDAQFLALCDDIINTRESVFFQQLSSFKEGVLAIVFDTLDRVQHMFFNGDTDLLDAWYIKFDALLGRIRQALRMFGHEDARLILVSDHGFAPFDHKAHLNRWLMEQNWLGAQTPEAQSTLSKVDWAQTRAYGVGLNSLYLNIEGREGQGIVSLDDLEQTRAQLRDSLLKWTGPDGRKVLDEVWMREDVFEGPFLKHSPDMLLGYAPGYRASAQTGLGGYGETAIEANTDHWNADHCINPAAVPGVIFTNFDLGDIEHPSYKDIPELVLNETFTPDAPEPPQRVSDEDMDTIEERMKGLGYL